MTYVQAAQLLETYELAAFAVLGLALAVLPPSAWRRINRTLRGGLQRINLSASPLPAVALLSVFLVGLADLLFAIACGLPEASVHDEFAYLLSGETLAAGALSNPTPPLEHHFESFHILTTPAYQGKYPPGQAMFLALGEAIAGTPAVGIWVSHALAAGGVCCFIGQFMSHRWALLGSLMFAFSDRLFVWWGQTYWGGAAAALGGAALFTGFAMFMRTPGWKSGIWMGTGAGVLSVTRPLEGLICCLVVFVGILIRMFAARADVQPRASLAVLAGGGLFVLPWLVAHGVYNRAITGSAIRMPYQVWMDQYGIGLQGSGQASAANRASYFTAYQHHFFAQQQYRYTRSFALWKFAHRLRPFFLPALSLLALLGICRPRGLLDWVLAVSIATLLTVVLVSPAGGFPHYLAPVAAPIALAVVSGLRWSAIRVPWFRRRRGFALIVLFSCLTISGLRLAIAWPRADVLQRSVQQMRQQIEMQIESQEAPDALVLVLYGAGHDPSTELVYNRPGIEHGSAEGGPRVVWARALGERADRELVQRFSRRTAYIYQLGVGPAVLAPFAAFADNHPGYSPPALAPRAAP